MKITTINARGLNKITKRSSFFEKFTKYDIICIQECYNLDRVAETWGQHWPGRLYYHPAIAYNSGGLIILLNQNFPCKNISVIDISERIIGLKFSHDKKDFVIFNIYAPSVKEERAAFFETLPSLIQTFTLNNHAILCGDFNNLISNEMDNISGLPHGEKEISAFINCLSLLDMSDSFRLINPEVRQYTWSKISKSNSHTDDTNTFEKDQNKDLSFSARRLDYIFINQLMKTYLINSEVEHYPKTDHMAVTSLFKFNDFPRGKGLWKFNDSLIGDPSFNSMMSEFIQETFLILKKDKDLSKQDIWELLKIEIRDKTIAYARDKSIQKLNSD